MTILGIILIIVGIALLLYSRVIGVHDSTLKAMGAIALKRIARIAGGLLIFIGILLAFT